MQHLALSLATAAALAALPCSLWYGSTTTPSSVSQGVEPVHRTAPGSIMTTAAAEGLELPIGVHLPADAVLLGVPQAVEHDGEHSDWRARVRLPRTSAVAALDSVESSLTAAGWQVERGSTDVFAVRRAGPRWELIQVIVDTSDPDEFHGSVIDVGIGSRTA